VASQLANLINRVIIADGWPPGEVESLHRAARRVSGRLEIGLLELGVLDESTCARTLVSVPLLHVAQAGQAAIVRRLNRARRLVRAAAGLSGMLAAPIPERLVALGRTRPVFVAQPGDPVREFEHPDDLNALDQDLDLLEAALLICQPLHLSLGALPNPFPPGSHPDSRQSLNLQSLLFTLFARDRLGLEPQTLPLPLNRLAGLQSAVATDPDALTAQILDWMQRLTGQTTPGMDRLARQMAGNAIEHILNQHPQTLDPRFVDGLWLLSESV
jgi:hypothetical protein